MSDAPIIYVDVSSMSSTDLNRYIGALQGRLSGAAEKGRRSGIIEVIANALSMLPWAGML